MIHCRSLRINSRASRCIRLPQGHHTTTRKAFVKCNTNTTYLHQRYQADSCPASHLTNGNLLLEIKIWGVWEDFMGTNWTEILVCEKSLCDAGIILRSITPEDAVNFFYEMARLVVKGFLIDRTSIVVLLCVCVCVSGELPSQAIGN